MGGFMPGPVPGQAQDVRSGTPFRSLWSFAHVWSHAFILPEAAQMLTWQVMCTLDSCGLGVCSLIL